MAYVLSRDSMCKVLAAKGFMVSYNSYFEESDYLDACSLHWISSGGEFYADLCLESDPCTLVVRFFPDDFTQARISWDYRFPVDYLVEFGFIKS